MFPKRAISGGSTTTLSQEAATGSSPGGVAASEQKTAYGTECIQMLGGHYVDSPNTTSAITYTLRIGGQGSANTIWGWQGMEDTLVIMEVKV